MKRLPLLYLSKRKGNAMGNRTDTDKEPYEMVTVFGQPMLFTESRIDRNTIPKGMCLYEVRHADNNWNKPCEIAEWVLVNHMGTLISNKPLELVSDGRVKYRIIKAKKDWNHGRKKLTLDEYIKIHPPIQNHAQKVTKNDYSQACYYDDITRMQNTARVLKSMRKTTKSKKKQQDGRER